uniref:Uncharacterized protein n=1 Tax=Vitis vinifera TaxID=29760 RepID=A5C9J6_VITVI|nr:hypothetical protein VITISV_021469 [Vitis vinifera]
MMALNTEIENDGGSERRNWRCGFERRNWRCGFERRNENAALNAKRKMNNGSECQMKKVMTLISK